MMDTPHPSGLTFIGYLKLSEIITLRNLGVRCWYDKSRKIPAALSGKNVYYYIYYAAAPQWVADSISLYESNRRECSGLGFAGLTWLEFVTKMTPDS